ncbi:MAG TPA: type II toxin-antitoxin system RelE/ParE family toxin [Rhizomicrobium sp.]|jgi:toxin ParE1/3/4
MAGYVISPRARSDIAEIWDYSVAQWNVEQADRDLRDLQRGFETIAAQPRIGRACDEIRPGYFKLPVASHVIFYRMVKQKVDIVRVLHRRMDYARRL